MALPNWPYEENLNSALADLEDETINKELIKITRSLFLPLSTT